MKYINGYTINITLHIQLDFFFQYVSLRKFQNDSVSALQQVHLQTGMSKNSKPKYEILLLLCLSVVPVIPCICQILPLPFLLSQGWVVGEGLSHKAEFIFMGLHHLSGSSRWIVSVPGPGGDQERKGLLRQILALHLWQSCTPRALPEICGSPGGCCHLLLVNGSWHFPSTWLSPILECRL